MNTYLTIFAQQEKDFFLNIRELNILIVTLLRNELNKNADNNEDNYPSLEVKSVIRR